MDDRADHLAQWWGGDPVTTNVDSGSQFARVALVTGAAGGIGRSIVETLARQQWNVFTTDLPGLHCDIGADLAQSGSASEIVTATLDTWGGLDLLVNNAATMYHGNFDLAQSASFWKTIAVNLTAPMQLTRAALPALRERRGQVINIASVFGIRPEGGYSAYCASKAGLIGLTKALALELAPAVRVNCVAPGHVDTPQQDVDAAAAGIDRDELLRRYATTIPIGRIIEPEEIARFVAFLAEEEGFTGSCLTIDGGHLLG
jgi:NAD(P)-dependent dehydrogenase (short-subunit alcohol dehydrogenase family)